MKNIGLKLLLAGLLSTSLLNAKIAFDLHAQHFSKAIAGTYEGARYELPKSFVSTNLKYIDGKYTTKNDNGYFNVEVKSPRTNWSVSLDVWYKLYYNNSARTIKLVADNGESISISFAPGDVVFDSKKVVTNLSGEERVTVEILRTGNNIELSVNGKKVGTAVRASFATLKYVEVSLINDYNSYYDNLHSLVIGSK
jgi:hypothetical protein